MKVVLQRVTHAQVTVEEQVVGKIGHGFLLLLGVEDADTVETADRMVEKIFFISKINVQCLFAHFKS